MLIVRWFVFASLSLGLGASCSSLSQSEPQLVSVDEEFIFSEAIAPEVFREAWKDDTLSQLVAYDSLSLKDLPIGEETRSFLSRAGLPNSCAPFLGFNEKLYTENLRTIREVLSLENDDFIHHYVIGSGEMGIIYIDSEDGDKIKMIDIAYAHRIDDNNTSPVHPDYVPQLFMNSSVGHLAHCLLIYRQFVDQIRAASNNQSFLDIEPTPRELDDLRQKLLQADPNCLSEKSFWAFETRSKSIDIKGPSGVKFN